MLHKRFENYLIQQGVSSKSSRNYLSDISHFYQWSLLKLKSFGVYISEINELIPFLTFKFISEYIEYLKSNNAPVKTINRRLSSLRHLAKYFLASQLLDSDFMSDIQNVSSLSRKKAPKLSVVDDFVIHLQAQKVSPGTIKNYQSDVRQFLAWLEKNHAHIT